MAEGTKPCRCLLAEARPDLARTVADYIASLPEEQRASAETQRKRLALCLGCAWLRDGTCMRCGCYAEARAARRAQSCPERRWLPEDPAGIP